MRDQNRVDRLRIDAGCLEIVEQTPAVSAIWPAVPVSISTSFAPVFTSNAVNEMGKILRRQKCSGERVVDLGAARIADEFLVDRHKPDAVIKRGELIAAEIVAIDAGALRLS